MNKQIQTHPLGLGEYFLEQCGMAEYSLGWNAASQAILIYLGLTCGQYNYHTHNLHFSCISKEYCMTPLTHVYTPEYQRLMSMQ